MYLEIIKKDGKPTVSGICNEHIAEILAFSQGAVYVWCQVHGSAPFAARDLVGGKNWNWRNTPLQCLYDKHFNQYIAANKTPEDAHKLAAENASQDIGRLLASVIANDDRKFPCPFVKNQVKHYSWDGKYEEKS